ncbi:hypothetical protein MJT46_008733 [Ovis ammon polii x Ovis aries]|nr:hypothetical protein MJT46_008733 [Ovis ammon polii x Ovis aries]
MLHSMVYSMERRKKKRSRTSVSTCDVYLEFMWNWKSHLFLEGEMNREGEKVEGKKGEASSIWDMSRLKHILQSKKSYALQLSPQKDLESEHRVGKVTH